MNVCIIRHGYFSSDPRVRKESEALVEAGHRVDVICLRKNREKSRESVCGVNVHRIPLEHRRGGILQYILEYALSFAMFSFAIAFLHIKNRYGAIQVNTMPDFLVFTTILPRLMGAKVLLDIHDVMPELCRSKFGFSNNHPAVKALALQESISIKYADHVFAACGRFLSLHLERGLSPSKVTLIHNVPEDDLFDYQKYPAKERSDKEFLVLSHGSILERYGFQVLIEAIDLASDDIPEIKAVILGDGEYLHHIMQLVKVKNLEARVCFIGRVPLEEVPPIISKVDICVFSAIKDDFMNMTAANKLFEYAAMKKPVIATAMGGIQDYFDHTCFLFFESGDARALSRCIHQLYSDPGSGQALADSAWERYKKIRWSVTKKDYQKIYENYNLTKNDRAQKT